LEDYFANGTEGIVTLHVVKCGVSGPPDTGKSRVRALMLGKDCPTERMSTPLAREADILTPDVIAEEDLITVKETKTGKVMWNEVKGDSLARVIANTLHGENYSKTTQPTGSSQTCVQGRFKLLKDVKKHLKELKGKSKTRKRKSLNGMQFVFFVDVGGQAQFQEILPNFVKNDINILVHNLSQELDDCPHFDYEVDGKKYSVPEEMKLSNLTIIEQSVRSITSALVTADVDRKPHVVIVGTFKDKCIPNSEGRPGEFERILREKSKTIKEKIKPYIGNGAGKCGVHCGRRDNLIVAIDGSEEGWHTNHNALEQLRSFINQQAKSRKFEVPIKYFVFLQLLRASKGLSYIILSECSDIASSCNMSQQDVKKALKLFSEFNIVLYYPGILGDIAFLQPDYLYGMVTKLIVASFQSESDCESNPFHTTGTFTAAILELFPFTKEFTKELFLKLLKGLYVIAQLDQGIYFMPCVLPLDELNNEATECLQIMRSNGIDGPFVLSFTNKMSPRGLFCAFLVALGGRDEWRLPDEHQQRHRNSVNFDLWKNNATVRVGTVTIVDRNSCLEIYTTCEGSECLNIRLTVISALEEACLSLNYSPKYLITSGFPCQCGAGEPHSTEVFLAGDKLKEKCKYHRKRLYLSRERNVWFGSDLTVGECNGSILMHIII
jgi:hypothetical protein